VIDRPTRLLLALTQAGEELAPAAAALAELGPEQTRQLITLLRQQRLAPWVAYQLRDPADVAVSLSHFWGWDLERTVAFLLDPQACMVRSRKRAGSQVRQSLGRWDQHLTSWCDQRLLPVLPLRYEDLLADPEHQFRRLAAFLNLAAGPEALALALEETRFEALRAKEEAAGGFVENSPHQERFFRSGRSGEGRERLSADQLAQLQAAFAPTLAAYGYATDRSLSTPLAS